MIYSTQLQQFTDIESHVLLKGLGDLSYFLGFEIKRDDTSMFITQKKCIHDLLLKFNMENASTCPTPMVVGKPFIANDGEPMQNPTLFRSLIGALQHVTNSRPDIVFSVNKLSRYLNILTLNHWQAAKRILRSGKFLVSF